MWQRALRDKRIIAGIVGLAVILTTIPFTLQLSREQQDIRQQAAEQAVCAVDQPTDSMLIFDASGSMKEPTSSTDPTTRLKRAQDAATTFVNNVAQRTQTPKNLVGFASFNAATEVSLEQEMTQFYDNVKTAITNVTLASDTCVECGIKDAIKAYDIDDRTTVKNVAILLSDGGATRYIGVQPPFTTETHREAERRSVEAAKQLYQKYKVTIYVIGFGTDVREGFLKEIADETGGKYYFAPSGTTLNQIYQEISTLIGKGEVNGKVFNDLNANGLQDEGELVLANQSVELINPSTNAVVASVKTDDTGVYRIQNLCDGAYRVVVKPPAGWVQTFPTNPDHYSTTITGGSVIKDQDFGIRLAPATPTPTLTPTPVPNLGTLNFTIFLHGIGNSGDNANPTAHSLSNKEPLHTTRDFAVRIFDANNQQVLEKTSEQMTYNPDNGNFQATVSLPANFQSGIYTIYVQSSHYLRKRLPGIRTLTNNQANVQPAVHLVTGDVKIDNALNILDYNIIIGCYSDFAPAPSCTPELKEDADITDDGEVNQFDYNLFLRDLSVQNGD